MPSELPMIATVLSKQCAESTVCLFHKGAVCPIETYIKEQHPSMEKTDGACFCGLATPECWYKFMLRCAEKDLELLLIS